MSELLIQQMKHEKRRLDKCGAHSLATLWQSAIDKIEQANSVDEITALAVRDFIASVEINAQPPKEVMHKDTYWQALRDVIQYGKDWADSYDKKD